MSGAPAAAAYLAYLADLAGRIARLASTNAEAIDAAASAIVATAEADGLVYVFGTGHSHMLAEEAHFRAGGLALVVPILAAPTMLHEGAVAGTAYERMSGIVAPILDRYPIRDIDTLFVVSNSGVNIVPVEAAEYGKARGARVVAITSLAYSAMAVGGGRRIADIADIVLDNGAPPGDAVVPLPGRDLRAGPVSTSIGAALLNAVLVEAATRLEAKGEAPVYLSANMPGAASVNAALVARYRPRNPHL